MTPPTGLEPHSAGDRPAFNGQGIVTCPCCGSQFPLPTIAKRVVSKEAQTPPHGSPVINRAVELEDATPTIAHPVNPRLAPTDRIDGATACDRKPPDP